MCNEYRLEVDIASIMEDFDNLEINLETPEGIPNVEPRAEIRITDTAPIVRSAEGKRGAGELVNRRWSWPGKSGPVYNFRSEGRDFTSGRCLILADGFYEHTAPQRGEKRKTKWLFTLKDHDWFCIAGIWRAHPDSGEAWTMLTTDPGEDVAPFHNRQIIPLTREQWADWLDPEVPAQEVLRVLPQGSLPVQRVHPPQPAQAALL